MRIVNREKFLKLPKGTLFYKYDPQVFGELSIKGHTMGNDFVCLSLNNVVDAKDSGELCDLLERAEDLGTDIPVAFDSFGRDGMFDEDQLFAVLSEEEARKLVAFMWEVVMRTEPSWTGGGRYL